MAFITQAQRTKLIELYVGYFNRAPEQAGLNFWANDLLTRLGQGKTEAQAFKEIADEFYKAGEQFGIFSAADPVEVFITKIYQNVLGRNTVDQAGMDYWKGKLNSGEVSRGQFVNQLIKEAKDYVAAAPANDPFKWVGTYLDNRVAVADWFANNSAGLTGQAAIQQGTAVIANSVTPTNAQNGQTVQQAVAAAQQASQSSAGQTFTLTPASGQVTEGTALSFTLKAAQKVDTDTTFTVVITGDDNGGTLGKASAADFPANVVSSVTIKAGSDSATFDLTPVANDGTEGLEGFKVTLLDSANKAVANSGVVAIKDGVTDITPPVIDANQSFTYAENQAEGFVVGTVKASDVGAGGGAGAVATFEIVGGNDNGFFAIDKDGKITLTEAGADKTKAANDFETAPNTFTLKVRAIDAAGNKSADTDVTLTVTDVDDTGPKFVSAAASGTQVKINFDEALKTVALSNPSALFTVTQGGTSYSVNTATISGNTVTLTLASALGSGDTFIAYDGTVLEDALGNKADKIASTKVTSTDTTPPTLTSSNPADDATDFAANANLTLTFNEAVKLGIGTITLVNTSDATDNRVINVQDATQVSVSGNTVTINPTADLKENASYAVNISPTAILDSAGNAFAGISDNTTLNFTTKAATPPSTPGQTFTLTISMVTGSFDNLTGTAGNDTFVAGNATLETSDVINGGNGTDKLEATSTVAATVSPTLTSVEHIYARTFGNHGGTYELNLANATGVTQAWAWNIEDTGGNGDDKLKFSGLSKSVTAGIKGGATTNANRANVEWAFNDVTGSSDSATLVLDGANVRDVTIGGVETLNIQATGANSTIGNELKVGAATKLVITGDKNLTIAGLDVADAANEIDASAFTGNLRVKLENQAVNVTFKGGSGNDRVDMNGTLAAGDNIDGGAGTNTIAGITAAAQLTAATGQLLKNFQVFDAAGAGAGNYNMDHIKGSGTTSTINSVVVSAALGGNVTIDNLAKGANVTINASTGVGNNLTINQKGAGDAGSNADTLTFELVAPASGGADITVANLTAADIETVTIKSTETAGVTTGHTLTAGTFANAQTVKFEGNEQLTVTNLTVAAATAIDASAMTDKFIMTNAFATPNAAVLIKGGSKDDTLRINENTSGTGSVIIGGGGKDTIHILDTGANNKQVIIKYTAASESSGSAWDNINGFVAGNGADGDDIDLSFLGFTGAKASQFNNSAKVTLSGNGAAMTFSISAANAAGFFNDAGTFRGVAIATDGTDTFVFVDANNDGNWSAADDMAILLVGVNGGAIVNGDFIFA
jgi:methionine-rich copper-binding protein CopC